MNLRRCDIDEVVLLSAEVKVTAEGRPVITATFGYRARGRPIGQVVLNGWDDGPACVAAAALVNALEQQAASLLGQPETEAPTAAPAVLPHD